MRSSSKAAVVQSLAKELVDMNTRMEFASTGEWHIGDKGMAVIQANVKARLYIYI